MDILKRLLLVLLLLGVLGGEIVRFDNGQSIAITFLDIGVILFVGISLLLNIFTKIPLTLSKFHKYTLWFVGVGLVALLLQIATLTQYQFLVALLYAGRFIMYTIGIALSVQLLDTTFKKHLPYLLFNVSTTLAILGVLQYKWYPELRNLYYGGWDPHLYRIFSTFLDPNFMGLFYVCGIILGIYMVLGALQAKDKALAVSFGIGIFLTVVALFLTYSRGSYLALLVGVGVILWRAGKKKFIFAALVLVVGILVVVQLFSPKSEGTKLLRTASIKDRVKSLQEVTTIISRHPFLGVGFDAYRYAQLKEGFLLDKENTTHSGAGTDNSFLFAFATTGLAGLFAYLLMTAEILKTSLKSNSLVGYALFATYSALIVGSFFVNALFFPFLLVWVWILIAQLI